MKISPTNTRRILFALILLGVAFPLLIKLGLPIETSENVRMVYDLVNSQPEGSHILISFDYDPASKPELHPMAYAIARNALERKYKVVCTALWPMGASLCAETFKRLKEEMPEIEEGVDFVNLGYKAGGIVTIQKMGADIRDVYPTDMSRKPIDELPIMSGVRNLKDFSFVCSISAGDPGLKQWVMVAHDKNKVVTTGGATAVSAPAILPYINEQKQLHGLLGGLKAAAEYEKLSGHIDIATSGMDAQSIAHLIIIAFIAIGNYQYHFIRKRKKGE